MAKGLKSFASQEAEWKAESDMRTLIEAAEIRKDKKRMQAAKKLARSKLEAVAVIVGETDKD